LYSEMRKAMKDKGLLFHPHPLFHHGVTMAHSSKDLKNLIQQMESFVQKKTQVPM
jgi:hypothetical protein